VSGLEGGLLAVVDDLERLSLCQRVPGLPMADLDEQPSPTEGQPEGKAVERLRELRRETQPATELAHATKPSDGSKP